MGSNPVPDTNIALVTGANQGIGFEISRMLGTEHKNYHILMAGRNLPAIEKAAATLKAEGLSVEPLHLDLASDDSIAAAAQHVSDKYGRLDALVNNAAISFGTPGSTDREEARQIYDINVYGVSAVTDAFIPLLKNATGTKRIVFLGSGIGSMAFRTDPSNNIFHIQQWLPYAASKTAGHYVAMFYASKFYDDPTWKVNISCPGLCTTNLNGFTEAGQPPRMGALNAVKLATVGPEGKTLTFTDRDGVVPW